LRKHGDSCNPGKLGRSMLRPYKGVCEKAWVKQKPRSGEMPGRGFCLLGCWG